MSDLSIGRMRLLNVSNAYSRVDVASNLLDEAARLLAAERDAGLPVSVDNMRLLRALDASKVARGLLWDFLKRMP